jgi:hypothetical protein
MKRLNLCRSVPLLALAIALAASTASAQEADTLSITGTFRSAESANINGFQYPGTIGADLAEVYANSNENAWMLTLHGVGYSHDYYYNEWGYGHGEEYITRVYATSADFEFFGPDADVLNEVVSQQLVGGFFELRHGYQLGSLFADDDGPYRFLELGLFSEGVSFYVNHAAWAAQFSADEQGYPVVEPQLVWASYSTISDYRPGNSGGLVSFGDLMHIGSAGPPLPLPPSLRVNDVTVTEGDTGTALATFTVSLSAASIQAITVVYATGNDTATADSDYQAVSNTLIFAPGETSKTVTVQVNGERLAEPNEAFFVNLGSPTNAVIHDGQGVGTSSTTSRESASATCPRRRGRRIRQHCTRSPSRSRPPTISR